VIWNSKQILAGDWPMRQMPGGLSGIAGSVFVLFVLGVILTAHC
jgi:hypothetical protein